MKSSAVFTVLAIILNCQTALSATTSTISQYGITWQFAEAVTYGQFITGDYWVVDPGEGVVITGISNSFHEATNLSTVDYDGTHINSYRTESEKTNGCGWDYKLACYNSAANVNKHLPYTVGAGNSVLTAISWIPGDAGIPLNVATGGVPQEKRIAVLTILSSDPGADAFRPSYSAGPKTIYHASAIQWNHLPALSSSGLGISDLAAYVATTRGPWTDLQDGYVSQYTRPTDNYLGGTGNAGTYNRYVAAKYGDAVLASMLDSTVGDKSQLVYNLIQIGIDYYGTLQAGGKWSADGGHRHGYKLPIMYAGLLLNVSGMLSIGDDYLPGTNTFQEDSTMFLVTPELLYPNRTVCGVNNGNPPCNTFYQSRQYTAENGAYIGMPEWGVIHLVNPNYDDADINAAYRVINAAPLAAHALAAQLLGLKPRWNNDIFFAYIDRWRTGMGGGMESTFASIMWDTYRDSSGEPDCDSLHLGLCNTSETCTAAGGHYCDGVCQSAECTVPSTGGPFLRFLSGGKLVKVQ